MRGPSGRSIRTNRDTALAPVRPGRLVRIVSGALVVDVAPEAGGRIAQVTFHEREWLVGYAASHDGAISWGCFPMVPWAGRIRRGRFTFERRHYQLPATLGAHAIHGAGFDVPWSIESRGLDRIELALQLPADDRWPFGGSARQILAVTDDRFTLTLAVRAGERTMPAVVGWHPWFLKPDAMRFMPYGYYPRDADGIAIAPLSRPGLGPWDDCFRNARPVTLERGPYALELRSSCAYWVVYDEPKHATCVEPQSGPPDAFNNGLATTLAPRDELVATFAWRWLQRSPRVSPVE